MQDEHEHGHKFSSGREHRAAHKAARQAAARIRTRSRRTAVRSEWLDRSPGAGIATRKRGGARYGPAPKAKVEA